MKAKIIGVLVVLLLFSCSSGKQFKTTQKTTLMETPSKKGYADVNGIKMYYEIYGQGKPLVLIHGGGSTIQTTFGSIIPMLSQNRQLIGVELQAHGHTSDRNSDLSFEQDADDVVALLNSLNIEKADFFGFSNGGTTALQIGIRHPKRVGKIIAASALSKRNGVPSQFWDFMKNATLDQMPQPYKEAYLNASAHPENLKIMCDKCAKRMVNFKDISDEQLQSIKAPVLIVIGDADVMTPEHAVEMHRLIPNSQLAIIPGGHGEYIGEINTLKPETKNTEFITPLLEKFLNH
ncbi:pimeloyl-ACP methyl ester carboxylesterase [Flavobacterium sp. 28YEA47A]|uniref:alpha/beta fold hydrolase n=1 Tax=Flavobacterium sp. 28YEA47A TaxID=3156276 RepID=UPI0035120E56